MKSKIIVILMSVLIATLLMSGGYGDWHKDLTIKGEISVIQPEITLITPETTVTKPETKNEPQLSEPAIPAESSNSSFIDSGANQENALEQQDQTLVIPEQLTESNGTGTTVDPATTQSSEEAKGS